MNRHSATAVWCGRLDLPLLDHQHRTACVLDLSLRIDICTVWYLTRTLAVIHRDDLRAWLYTPTEPFLVDDLVWSLDGPSVALSIDRQPPYLVPEVFIGQLISVI